MTSERPIVVFEHQADGGAGFLGEWLDARGLAWTIVGPGEPAPAAARALVTLGSSRSAYDAEPTWIPAHLDLLREALAAQTPVLGICFGAQALALAAGGSVARAEEPEIGWVTPETDVTELAGPWLAWHLDAISAPVEAAVLAHTARAVQVFQLGRSLGVQFHPEVTAENWAIWTERNRATAPQHLGDPDAFTADVIDRTGELRARQFTLLDWWRRSVLGD